MWSPCTTFLPNERKALESRGYPQRADYAMILPMNESSSNDIHEVHAMVRGRVQGVGYRYFVVEHALTLGLRGYARNRRDDSVEVVAQGSRFVLERLLALLRQGPPAADVSQVDTIWREPTEHFSGFHVRW